MKELLAKAVELNHFLTVALQDARHAKAEANNTAANARQLKESLEAKLIAVSAREEAVKEIENVQALSVDAQNSKAAAELEWAKINDEWTKIKDRKTKDLGELQDGLDDIKQKKELYDRGAQENKIAKEKLDKKLKTIAELKG